MEDAWTKCKCEQCKKEYIFIDGPVCLCDGEWKSWNEKYQEAFTDNLLGSDDNGN